MPLPERGPAPYAPGHTVLGFINHVREKGLPNRIDQEYIGLIHEVGTSYARRTLRAVEQLDLVNPETGEPTQTLRDLQQVPGEEFKDKLADWFKGGYAPILRFVSADDTIERVTGQFQRYSPTGQKDRMVQLFLNIAHEAGLRPDVPKMPRGAKSKTTPGARTETKPRKADGQANQQVAKTPKKDATPNETLTGEAKVYFDLLIRLIQDSEDDPPAELLDRVERVLGVQQEVSP